MEVSRLEVKISIVKNKDKWLFPLLKTKKASWLYGALRFLFFISFSLSSLFANISGLSFI